MGVLAFFLLHRWQLLWLLTELLMGLVSDRDLHDPSYQGRLLLLILLLLSLEDGGVFHLFSLSLYRLSLLFLYLVPRLLYLHIGLLDLLLDLFHLMLQSSLPFLDSFLPLLLFSQLRLLLRNLEICLG